MGLLLIFYLFFRKNEAGDFCYCQFDYIDPQIGHVAFPICNFRSADDDDYDGLHVVVVDEVVGVVVVAHNIVVGPVPLLHAASWCWNLRGQLTNIEDNNEGVPDCKSKKKNFFFVKSNFFKIVDRMK